jgi:hypothetical protein
VRSRINIAWVQQWRDQLLAEAYALYQQGTPYTPSPAEEEQLFVPMQESRLVDTAVLSEMTHLLNRAPAAAGSAAVVNARTQFVTISQLTFALGVDAAKSGPALEAQVRAWLDHEGWQRVKKQINGVRAWGYERPAPKPTADFASALAQAAGAEAKLAPCLEAAPRPAPEPRLASGAEARAEARPTPSADHTHPTPAAAATGQADQSRSEDDAPF